MKEIKGTGIALVTPFNEDLSVDYTGLERLLNHVINKVDYLVLMGTTAESVVLTKKEKQEVVDFCKSFNSGKLPIVLGIGGNNTSQLVSEIQEIDKEGITAILSVSPYYNKPIQDGIYLHYKLIAEMSSLPIIIYNVPSRTGSNITAETTLRLASDFDNIVGIKEASGDLEQVMQIINNKPKNFVVISGDDSLTLPILYLGGEGVISVIAQSHPKEYTAMVHNARLGDIEKANRLHYQLYNYYQPLYKEGNPTGIKACLELLGICNSYVRPPLVQASSRVKQSLISLLEI